MSTSADFMIISIHWRYSAALMDVLYTFPGNLSVYFYFCIQGRIKVRGGPRLDTVMGPYPFSSHIKLSSTTHTEFFGGVAPGKF